MYFCLNSFSIILKGNRVQLRHATMQDRLPIFEWLAEMDLTHHLFGAPDFVDVPYQSGKSF
jgi:hypothetical protein